MNKPAPDPARQNADGSILDAIPTPDEIREAMSRNADENRVLRSLYRVSRRVAERKRQTADARQGVAREA